MSGSISIESRIRELSQAIILATEESEVLVLTHELQATIHEHIEYLRAKLLQVPAYIERIERS